MLWSEILRIEADDLKEYLTQYPDKTPGTDILKRVVRALTDFKVLKDINLPNIPLRRRISPVGDRD